MLWTGKSLARPCDSLCRTQAYLLIEGNLLHVGLGLVGEIGLAGTDGVRAAQRQIIVEAVAQGSPRVKQTLQAPAQQRSCPFR